MPVDSHAPALSISRTAEESILLCFVMWVALLADRPMRSYWEDGSLAVTLDAVQKLMCNGMLFFFRFCGVA